MHKGPSMTWFIDICLPLISIVVNATGGFVAWMGELSNVSVVIYLGVPVAH